MRLLKGSVCMARVVIEQLVDDLDGGKAAETVNFSYRGVDYEIDLGAKNAKALDKVMAPYLEVARRVPRKRAAGQRSASKASNGAPDAGLVRAWAKAQGLQVSDRGRVSADIVNQYREASGG